MANKIQILHEGHEQWEILRITRTWETWEIQQLHDGDVEICCDSEESCKSLFLSQDELKRVITFLQSKVKC